MGDVILGMPGRWAENNREKSDHYTTKIGGFPDWPIKDADIKLDLVQCKLCGGKLCLIAQIYAPVLTPKSSIEDRVIYVLGCPLPECGSNPQSWRALRVQKCQDETQISGSSPKAMPLEEECAPAKELNGTSEGHLSTDCTEENDDEGDSDLDLEDLARALAEAATLASQSKKQNGSKRPNSTAKGPAVKQRVDNANMPFLPCFYVYPEKELYAGKSNPVSVGDSAISIKENQSNTSDHEDEEKWEGENYEYDRALGADRTYLKFKKQLDAYPEQCFRYSYGGNPLLATPNLPKPETCKLCGSLRHYEFQLMPPLLYFLHQAADDSSVCSPDEWTWMTLIIYTCSKSCCPSLCAEKPGGCCWGVSEEEIIIQDDS
ncbi:programmed cell death protein 2-like [Ananas comosus]|uniref:Programmed cell death protein 2-like n=1 Tax=Ananas comosus TaxID=4615 RepID=A0A6P5GNP1_ANACO|nr:programmed cell death protein 2-like [Ananas comosus]